jgi:hypothetical protein
LTRYRPYARLICSFFASEGGGGIRIGLRLAVVIAIVIAAGAVPSAGDTAASADCSQATALRLGKPYAFDPSAPKVELELCGSFLGQGSEAMVVSFGAPTCWPLQSWAIFGFAAGSWKLIKRIPAFLAPPRHLVAVGHDIRETTAVHRRGDPRCLPSGGKHARIWHWNGTAFVAGPWKQVSPPTTRPQPVEGTFKYGYFRTPSGNIHCDWGYGGNSRAWVRCGIRSGLKPPPPSRGPGCEQRPWFEMNPTGRPRLGPSICPGEDEGDAGPFSGGQTAKVLGYGRSWIGARMRCASAFDGLTCRNASGHGWFLSRTRSRMF